jgi:hypothetical protein
MDGLALEPGRAGATSSVPSPWIYQNSSFRATSGGASYAWIPQGAYLHQNTGAPTDPTWEALLDPGATGVLVEFTVLLSQDATGVWYHLAVGGNDVDSGHPGAGRYSKVVSFPTPTTAPLGVEITFGTVTSPAVGIDDVVVQGIYP